MSGTSETDHEEETEVHVHRVSDGGTTRDGGLLVGMFGEDHEETPMKAVFFWSCGIALLSGSVGYASAVVRLVYTTDLTWAVAIPAAAPDAVGTFAMIGLSVIIVFAYSNIRHQVEEGFRDE